MNIQYRKDSDTGEVEITVNGNVVGYVSETYSPGQHTALGQHKEVISTCPSFDDAERFVLAQRF